MNNEFLYKSNCSVIVFNDFNFNALSNDELNLIEKNSTELKYKKNEIIIKQGTFSTNVVYLRNGLVKLKMDGNIKPLILKIVSSNSIIGLTSLTNKYNTNTRIKAEPEWVQAVRVPAIIPFVTSACLDTK